MHTLHSPQNAQHHRRPLYTGRPQRHSEALSLLRSSSGAARMSPQADLSPHPCQWGKGQVGPGATASPLQQLQPPPPHTKLKGIHPSTAPATYWSPVGCCSGMRSGRESCLVSVLHLTHGVKNWQQQSSGYEQDLGLGEKGQGL